MLVLWHSLDNKRAQVLEALIDRWNAVNPHGLIIVPERRSPMQQHQAMLEGAVGGRLPDLALVEPDQASLYVQRGALTNLDGLVNNSDPTLGWSAEDRQDLFPFVLQAGRDARGRLFGIPQGGRAQAVLINQNLLRANDLTSLPSDLDALGKACARLASVNLGTACFAVASDSMTFEAWALAHGAQLYSSDGVQVGAAPVSTMLQFLLEAVRTGQAYRTLSQARAVSEFASGRVLFVLLWNTDLDAAWREIQSQAKFDLATALLPSQQGQAQATPSQAPLWVIPAKPRERVEAAWRAVRWLLETEQTTLYAEGTGELPARTSALERLQGEPNTLRALRHALFQQLGPAARPEPMVSGWSCVRDQLAAALRRALSEQENIPDVLLDTQVSAQRLLFEDCTGE
ncbi:MAG: extracellular solute-binding protein [Thermoflexales bacterium]|nr:extracellular solute-binding protein [Thermoflexales bacterium]